jgi:hypothetical protein
VLLLWKLLYPRLVLGILLEYDSTELAPNVRIIAFVVPAESGKSLSELNLRFWESLSEIKSE